MHDGTARKVDDVIDSACNPLIGMGVLIRAEPASRGPACDRARDFPVIFSFEVS